MFFTPLDTECSGKCVFCTRLWLLEQDSVFFSHCHHLEVQVVRFLHCLFPVTLSSVFFTLAAYPKCGIGFYLYQVFISYYCAYEKTTKYY